MQDDEEEVAPCAETDPMLRVDLWAVDTLIGLGPIRDMIHLDTSKLPGLPGQDQEGAVR